ncbi:hypothetical protein, partial [Streptomyces sp. SP17KL33]|uniref:hypothetical protein n=1 Tax=Streptomyces sp. SP17KL33 TaxID=3002534 RepID=UPI002E7EAF79|nr:hypothetical protein [Streptomyces sp. SP17KL33]
DSVRIPRGVGRLRRSAGTMWSAGARRNADASGEPGSPPHRAVGARPVPLALVGEAAAIHGALAEAGTRLADLDLLESLVCVTFAERARC